MLQVKFTSNPNGKLFNHRFSDIRLSDQEKYAVGNILAVQLSSKELGYVKVISFREFEFRQINDTVAYLNCGQPAAYQAELLTRYYFTTCKLQPRTKMIQIVFEYTQRDLQQHKYLMQEWWNDLVENSQYVNTSKDFL